MCLHGLTMQAIRLLLTAWTTISMQMIEWWKKRASCVWLFSCSTIWTGIVRRAEVWSVLTTCPGRWCQWFQLDFYKGDNEVFDRRHPLIPEQQQIVLPHSLQCSLCTTACHHKFYGHPGVTEMRPTLQQTYYWPQMAADWTFAVHGCVQCRKFGFVCANNLAPLKLFPAFKPLESVAIGILGTLPKSRRGFQRIIVIVYWFTNVVYAVQLRRIRSVNVA